MFSGTSGAAILQRFLFPIREEQPVCIYWRFLHVLPAFSPESCQQWGASVTGWISALPCPKWWMQKVTLTLQKGKMSPQAMWVVSLGFFVWTGLRVFLTLGKKVILWDSKRKRGLGNSWCHPSLSQVLIPSAERSSPLLPWVTWVLSATLSCSLREGIQSRNQVIGVLRTYKWAHIGGLSY